MLLAYYLSTISIYYHIDEERTKRRENRKFPRSTAQLRVDAVEDNTGESLGINGLNRALELSGFGLPRLSSRVYELTSLQTLVS